jgi:hypothetical protein
MSKRWSYNDQLFVGIIIEKPNIDIMAVLRTGRTEGRKVRELKGY